MIYKAQLLLITFFVVLSSNGLFSQDGNLIPNSGFEKYKVLPDDISQGKKCIKDWTVPVMIGRGDYYHSSSKNKKSGTKKNSFGKQAPHTGLAYMGICVSKKFREYVQVKLIKPLEKNREYLIKVYISCGDKLYLSTVEEFNILFSSEAFYVPNNEFLLRAPQIKFENKKSFKNTKEWIELSTVYTANGTENYLTFGSFLYKDGGMEHGKISGIMNYAHYYIDDFSIIALEKEVANLAPAVDTIIEKSEDNFELGETFVLENLHFKTGESDILPESFTPLDALILYLVENPEVKLQITGHTDDQGDFDDNMTLSYNRAKAVMLYIISNSEIDKNVILIEGKGELEPAFSNEDELGREKNRRVEFTFY